MENFTKKSDLNLTLYAITHKELITPPPLERTLIGVGNNRNIPNVQIYDNTGSDNISEKNDFFCELTALYWIWKNDHSEYVGLEHYRRYFLKKRRLPYSFMTKKRALKILFRYDMIVPQLYNCTDIERKRTNITVLEQYDSWHVLSDLKCCRKIIELKYPDYIPAFDNLMKRRSFHLYNMFIMRKDLLDKYCSWLFDILFEAEKEIDLENRKDYQKRAMGYLAERLFNVWIIKNNLREYHVAVVNIELQGGILRIIKNKLIKKHKRTNQ